MNLMIFVLEEKRNVTVFKVIFNPTLLTAAKTALTILEIFYSQKHFLEAILKEKC